MAVRPGRGDSGVVRPAAHHGRNPGALRRRHASSPATSSASAFTPATRFAATRSAHSRGPAGRRSSSAASTPRCTRTRRTVSAARTPSSRATATWSGRSCSTTRRTARLQPIYEAGRVDADQFVAARWELLPQGRYMWGSVQTVRGCPKHCSFCSVWRTDGQKPRQRGVDAVVEEIVELRRRGLSFRGACRRQLLSGHAGRSRDGGAPAQRRRGSSSCGRCAPSDSS